MKSKIVPIGRGSLAITSEDFLNGFQAGHLSYMVNRSEVLSSDESLTTLFLDKLECMDHSSRYSMGYVVGWLATLANKGQKGGPA